MKPILFIDRDGVLLKEPPDTFQIDTIDKTVFVPGSITALSKIAGELDFYKVMISNQDGLGTAIFPEEKFTTIQDLLLRTLRGEGFEFDEVLIDKSFEADNAPTRKPGLGLVTHLLDGEKYDLQNSFVIGDRGTDIQLAMNIGCRAIYLKALHQLSPEQELLYKDTIVCEANSWNEIYAFLKKGTGKIVHDRVTNETNVHIELNLNGEGRADIETGLGFFNHMLEQIARHGRCNLQIITKGDLHIDEHHTIEDTGIALGEAFGKLLADKRGLERYGFALPMDESAAKVLIDFGGRSAVIWDVSFKREKIGDMPTEMFYHFFKSFSDAAKCNLHIECTGINEHHKSEAIFKAFARAIRMAVKKDPLSNYLPSTKGLL